MKHKLTRLTSLVLAFIMTFSMLLVPVEATGFTDVPNGSWYQGAVDYVYGKGWMVGVDESTFAPDMEVTRGMFVTVLAKFAEADMGAVTPAFTDTPAGAWYTAACAWAAEKGIVAGAGNGRFLPNRSITRQDLAAILYRFIEKQGYDITAGQPVSFNDAASISAYAVDAVNFVSSVGLMTGADGGKFLPKETATRSQLAQILMKLDGLVNGTTQPEDPRPAQGFDGEDGDITITVNAPEGALPEDSTMSVDRVTDEDALATIQSQFMSDVFAAVDISFADKDGVEIEPQALVEVEIALDGLENVQNPTVVHMKDDGSVELIGSKLVSVNRSGSEKALRFYANSFSVYAIIGNSTEALRTITVYFYAKENGSTGNYHTVNVQKLRVQEILEREYPFFDPGVPGIAKTQSFEGWVADEPNYTENSFGYDVDGLNEAAKAIAENWDLLVTDEDQENIDMDFYAKIYDVVYVIYHDQAGAVQDTVMHHIQPNATSVEVPIDYDYVPFKDFQKMVGWVEERYVDTLGKYPTYKEGASANAIKNDTTRSVSHTLELYPYLENGYWLSFDNNIAKNNEINGFEDPTRAAYVAPHFYGKTEIPSFPEIPGHTRENARPGYYLEGWYKDPDLRNKYNFDEPLTRDTTVYAKWEKRSNAKYRVVFWQQRSTDPVDAVNTLPEPNTENKVEKTWDYYAPTTVEVVREAEPGTWVSLLDADKRLGNRNNSTSNYGEMGYFFDFNTELSTTGSVQVKGDGSTVLHAYYDRKVITINFLTAIGNYPYDAAGSQYTVSGQYRRDLYCNVNYKHYGVVNNQYVELNLASSDPAYPDENGWIPAGYVYRTSTSSSWTINTSTSKCVWTRASNGSSYSGTIYTYDPETDATTSNAHLWYTTQGLYKAPLDWPLGNNPDIMWHIDFSETNNSQSVDLTPRDNYDIMDAKYTTEYNLYLRYDDGSGKKTVHWMKENVDGTAYEEAFATSISSGYGSQSYTVNKFMGFTAYGHNLTTNSTTSGFVKPSSESQMTMSYSSMGSNSYIYYNRNKYRLNFDSNNEIITSLPSGYADPTKINYQKKLTEYASFVPDNGPDGMYFVGWYADPGFTREFDFTQEMPDHNLTAYAKWETKYYRIVIHMVPEVKPGEAQPQITIPGTTQDTTFCLAYGSQIQTSALMGAQWENHMILGLYFDKNYKNRFNPEDEAPFGITDESYATAPDSEREGYDEFGDKEWSDVGWDNVKGRIDLYARWRADPDGAIGVNVEYWANHDEEDTGYFDVDNQPDTWTDPKIYADLANAYGQPASKPDDTNEQFLYWEVLDENDEPTGERVYPGKTFEVHLEDAKAERVLIENPNPQPNEEGPTDTVQPENTRGGSLNPVTYTPECWVPYNESTIDTTKEYLIGFVYNGNTYLALNYNPNGSGSTRYYYTNRFSYNGTTGGNSYIGYTATPTFSGSNITAISGLTNNIQYATWKFNSVSNGYEIVSAYESARYLYAYFGGSSASSYYDDQYPNTTASVWTWDASNHSLKTDNTTNNTYAGVVLIGSTAYMRPSLTTGEPAYVQLYVKQPAKYTLRVQYQLEGGASAGISDHVEELEVGASYSVNSPAKDGYWADPATVSGTMTAEDKTVTVTYHPIVLENEQWEPTTEIVPGEEYLIAYMLNDEPYLLVNYNENASNSYYYPASYNSNTYRLGYLSKAVVDSSTGYVTAVTGSAATKIANCQWIFSAANGGVVTSAQNSDRFLYFSNLAVYPETSQTTWVWNVTDSSNNLGSLYTVYAGSSGNQNWQLCALNYDNSNLTIFSSGDTTNVYAGCQSSYSTNVRLYKRHIDTSSTFTVTFQDYDMSLISEQNVTYGNFAIKPADPVRQDYYFLGWYEGNADNPFDFSQPITKDTALVARYLYMYEVTYTVRLRAVYGMRHTTPDTHIYWYENNGENAGHGAGAGDRYEDEPVPMYTATGVPYPTAAETPEGAVTWHTPEVNGVSEKTALTREGYVFLGWARLETSGTGTTGEGHPELSARDLYLEWDSASGMYKYHNPANPNDENDGAYVTQVYATEDQPYHDFYAVWYQIPKPFFVYHSATGKLEAIDKNKIGSFYDLTQVVTPGYLYGGYYVETGNDGVIGCLPKATMDSIVSSYFSGDTRWQMDTDETSPILASYTINSNPNQLDVAEGFSTYTGAMYTNGQGTPYKVLEYDETTGNPKTIERENGSIKLYPLYWDKADVVAKENNGLRGDSLIPADGTVYYIKEVPSSYLTSKILYTYDIRDLPIPGAEPDPETGEVPTQKNQLVDLWVLSVTDDASYSDVGFQLVSGKTVEGLKASDNYQSLDKLAKSFSLIQKPSTTVKVEPYDFGLKRGCGYVAVKHLSSFVNNGNPGFTMLPCWTTPDDVRVYNNGLYWSKVQKEYDPENPAVPELSWQRVFDGTEKMYFNLWHDNWTDNAPLQKVYFFKGEGAEAVHAWVDLEYLGDNGMHAVTVPAGEWDHVILVRMKPEGQMSGFDPNNEDTFWDNKDKQTGDIALNTGNSVKSNSNCIDSFYGGQTAVTWAYYPAIPS